MIGAVLTYLDNGSRRICGQTLGADGRGMFAVLFESETVDMAHEKAREYIGNIVSKSEYKGHITEIHIVPAEECYYGNAVRVVKC